MVSGVYLLGGRASIHFASEITRPVLESWQRYLYLYRKERLKPFSSWTQRTALQPLQVWFRWMTRQSLILANPAAVPEQPRLEKHLPRTILSLEQIEEILSLCNLTTLQGVRDRALRELLLSTGIPCGETAVLDIYCADFSRKIPTIGQGKWRQYRVIPVDERAVWWLDLYLHHVRPEVLAVPACKTLFLAMDGLAGLTLFGITQAVLPYQGAVGIAKGAATCSGM